MLEEELSQSAKRLVEELSSYEESTTIDSILKEKVQEVIGKVNSESFLGTDQEEIFNAMWKSQTEEILEKMPQKLTSEVFIKTMVEKAVRDTLGPDYFMYIKKKADKSNKFDDQGFTVKQQHVRETTKIAPHTLRQMREVTEEMVKRTSVHYKVVEKGREFEAKHVETLFKDIHNEIIQINKTGLEITLDYTVDLMMYIEELAVKNFFWNQRAYEENRCPRKLLEKKKKAYFEIFQIATGHGSPAMEFGEIILKVIEENLEDQVTCTELLDILRIHQGDIFRSAGNLEFVSVIEFLIGNSLTEYRLPIVEYKEKIKKTITEESIACLEKDNRLKSHAIAKLNAIIAEVKCSVETTVQSECESKDFVETLFSNMKGLKKPEQ